MKIELITRKVEKREWYQLHSEVVTERWYRLLEDYTFTCGVTVKADFEWNGASSPFLCSLIIPKAHGTLIASCIHDYLCGLAKDKEERQEADKVFLGELVAQGVSESRSKWGYRGVRVGAFFGVGSTF